MGERAMDRRKFLIGTSAAGALLWHGSAHAQFGGLGNVVRGLGAPKLPKFFSGPQPVSTNIKDAVYGEPASDGLRPGTRVASLSSLQRTDYGGFVLAAGSYQLSSQSYCLHAGTHGPGGGDAYLYGPLKGSAQDAIATILRNSVAKPEISQSDIQLLLWAIISRSKFEDLNGQLKAVASQLLSPKQITSLNRSALSILTSSEFQRLTGGMPGPLRSIVEAESRMRSMFSGPALAFQDMERVAMLAGAVPLGEGSLDVPAIRWSRHPDGYLVRYTPRGYSNTLIEIHVEPGSSAVGKIYDPAVQVAIPCNTSRQRIGLSGRARRA